MRNAGAHINGATVANGHGRKHKLSIAQFNHANGRFLRKRDVVADGQQVPRAAANVNAAVNVNVLANARAKQPQNRVEENSSFKHAPRNCARDLLHAPEAQVARAKYRHGCCADAAKQHALCKHGKRNGECAVDDQRDGNEH